MLGSLDANVTYNWWGASDIVQIGNSIYDSKNDFTLGTVNFVPFLTEPNPQATPTSNPSPTSTPTPTQSPSYVPSPTPVPSISEFPTSIIMLLLVAATLSLVVVRRKQKHHFTVK